MENRRTSLFVVLATGIVAAGTRLFPLWWSGLPATLDGLTYAALARETLASGHIPIAGFRADAFMSTLLLSLGARVTGVTPLYLAQPLYAVIGAATVFLGFLFVRRLGRAWNWRERRIRWTGALAAVALATEGIFVRRTGVPDDDVLTLLLIPLAAYAGFRYTQTARWRWFVAFVAIVIALPLMHTFSTLLAALTLGVISVLQINHRGLTRENLVLGGTIAGFWVYFVTYYQWAESTVLTVPYVSRVFSHLGLFVAWMIVLVLGVLWFQHASSRARRATVGLPFVLFFATVAVNTVTAVFPGTSQTPPFVLLLVAPLAIPAALAAWGSPVLAREGTVGTVLCALLAAPVVQILYSLSVSLTPEFFATAMRAQSHLHLPVLVLASAVVTRHAIQIRAENEQRPTLRRVAAWARPALLLIFVVSVVTTAPIAYLNFDTGTYPSTTTESDFDAATFAAAQLETQWTSSQPGVRIAANYYSGVNATVQPTVIWIHGGPSPRCPVVSWRYWTTTGAHLFPAAPATIPPGRYDRWIARRELVYTSGGYNRVSVTLPRTATPGGC